MSGKPDGCCFLRQKILSFRPHSDFYPLGAAILLLLLYGPGRCLLLDGVTKTGWRAKPVGRCRINKMPLRSIIDLVFNV